MPRCLPRRSNRTGGSAKKLEPPVLQWHRDHLCFGPNIAQARELGLCSMRQAQRHGRGRRCPWQARGGDRGGCGDRAGGGDGGRGVPEGEAQVGEADGGGSGQGRQKQGGLAASWLHHRSCHRAPQLPRGLGDLHGDHGRQLGWHCCGHGHRSAQHSRGSRRCRSRLLQFRKEVEGDLLGNHVGYVRALGGGSLDT